MRTASFVAISGTVLLATGGKEVTVWTDDADGVAYLYPSGDVLFVVANVTESQAGQLFAALP